MVRFYLYDLIDILKKLGARLQQIFYSFFPKDNRIDIILHIVAKGLGYAMSSSVGKQLTLQACLPAGRYTPNRKSASSDP
jgi:hypothetical protein